MFMTYEKLTAAGAYEEQSLLFKQMFPKGVQVTHELCLKYYDTFDFDYWAARLLPRDQGMEYDRVTAPARDEYSRAISSARAEYDRAKASALAEYSRAISSARAEYSRAISSARAEYDRVTAPALAEYCRVRVPALAEYNRVIASAFGALAETV